MENREQNIISGPTIVRKTSWVYEQKIIKTNEANFDLILSTVAPELYIIAQSLKLFKINGEILPPVIKAIADIVYSSKLGEVIIEIRPDPKTGEAVVRRVRSIDTRHLDLQALNKI
jgi:hypothetical protein